MGSEAKVGGWEKYPARLVKWAVDSTGVGSISVPPGILLSILMGHIQGASGPVGVAVVAEGVWEGPWLMAEDATSSPGRWDIGAYCPKGASVGCVRPTVLLVAYIPMENVAELG